MTLEKALHISNRQVQHLCVADFELCLYCEMQTMVSTHISHYRNSRCDNLCKASDHLELSK